MNPQIWWHLARASGIVAWLMLTASVLWGVVLSTKAFPDRRRPAWLLDLHRWLGGLTLVFIGIHLGTLLLDEYTSFGIVDLVVPYASDWKPGAVALGVVALWLLVAVQLTSLMMKKLPKRFWRAVHLTSYLAFWATSLHASAAGTDRTNHLYQVTSIVAIVAVVWAALYRLTHRRPDRGRPRAGSTPGPADPAGREPAAVSGPRPGA